MSAYPPERQIPYEEGRINKKVTEVHSVVNELVIAFCFTERFQRNNECSCSNQVMTHEKNVMIFYFT